MKFLDISRKSVIGYFGTFTGLGLIVAGMLSIPKTIFIGASLFFIGWLVILLTFVKIGIIKKPFLKLKRSLKLK